VLVVGEAASKLLTFVAFAYLARVAGPVGFGQVEFAVAVLQCASLVVDLGFNLYGAKEIAKAPARTAELVGEIVVARFGVALASYLAIALMAWLSSPSPAVTRLLLIYGLSVLPMPLLLSWVFQGHDQMATVAVSVFIRQFVFAVTVFSILRDASGVWLVAVAEVSGVVAAATYLVWQYRRRFTGKLVIWRFPSVMRMVRDVLPIGLSQMFWAARMFGGTILLGYAATANEVGWFAAALRILIAVHTFVWLFYYNLLPSLSRAWQADHADFRDKIDRSLHWVVWVGGAVGVVWVALAPTVMTLAYSEAFGDGGVVLQWMAGVWIGALLSGYYRFGLVAAGRQTVELVTTAAGMVSAGVLIFVGYVYYGVGGAAAGLFGAELVVLVSAWALARRHLRLTGHVRLLVLPAIGGLTAWAVRYLVPLNNALAIAALALITFTLFALLVDRRVRQALVRQCATSFKIHSARCAK
jgi:PST family polysaccharide transporter